MEKTKTMPKVAFVCNHNSCRSQIAEALGKLYGEGIFESYSAGTEIKNCINPDAVRLVAEIYGIDMEKSQRNKTIFEIPKPDLVVFMGCNVSCPSLSGEQNENWGLDDPSGKDDTEFKKIIAIIDKKVKNLCKQLSKNSK